MGKRSGGRGRINPALTELDKLELGLSEENTRRPDNVISNRLVADVRYYRRIVSHFTSYFTLVLGSLVRYSGCYGY